MNEVVNGGSEAVVERAVEFAEMISENSPDSVIISREGIKVGWEGVSAEEGSRLLVDGWNKKLNSGENIKERARAFVEKRKPRWIPNKLKNTLEPCYPELAITSHDCNQPSSGRAMRSG